MFKVISIHSLKKRETIWYQMQQLHQLLFQSTPSRRGRHSVTLSHLKITYFNPLPQEEGDLSSIFMPTRCISNFNPLPQEEGDSQALFLLSEYNNFNPLPQEEGDGQHVNVSSFRNISIHSLKKRETMRCRFSKI